MKRDLLIDVLHVPSTFKSPSLSRSPESLKLNSFHAGELEEVTGGVLQRPTFYFKSVSRPDHNHQQQPLPTHAIQIRPIVVCVLPGYTNSWLDVTNTAHSITCAHPWKNKCHPKPMGMGGFGDGYPMLGSGVLI